MSRPGAVVVAVIALLAVTTLAFAQQTPVPSSNRTTYVVIPLKYANPALIAALLGANVTPMLNDAQWAQMSGGGQWGGGQNGGYAAGNRQSLTNQPVYSAGNSVYSDPGSAYGSRLPSYARGGYLRQPASAQPPLVLP